MDHAQASGSIPCGSRQARAGDLGTEYVKAERVDTDSDYAGCVLTRTSTTCAHLFHGVNLIKAGSWTQGTRSLSVAESEFYAGVKGASIVLGAKSMMIDFGEDVAQCVPGTDSS